MTHPAGPASVKARLAEELRAYLALSLYLYVCLGAILLYRSALMEEHGIGHVQFGTAALKALVLAKFAMLGRIGGIGEVSADRPLIGSVLRGSLGLLGLLVALTLLEEVVVGALSGRGADGVLAEIAAGRWLEIGATALLIWLVLVPYLAFQHLFRAIGADRARRLLFGD